MVRVQEKAVFAGMLNYTIHFSLHSKWVRIKGSTDKTIATAWTIYDL
jgi:hypothetical protein